MITALKTMPSKIALKNRRLRRSERDPLLPR
jgi:hypothetical protein